MYTVVKNSTQNLLQRYIDASPCSRCSGMHLHSTACLLGDSTDVITNHPKAMPTDYASISSLNQSVLVLTTTQGSY